MNTELKQIYIQSFSLVSLTGLAGANNMEMGVAHSLVDTIEDMTHGMLSNYLSSKC